MRLGPRQRALLRAAADNRPDVTHAGQGRMLVWVDGEDTPVPESSVTRLEDLDLITYVERLPTGKRRTYTTHVVLTPEGRKVLTDLEARP